MHWFLDQCAQVLVNCDETGWMFVALRSSILETSSVAFLGGLTESGPHWTELAGAHDARRPFRGAPGVMDTRRQSTPGGSKRQPPAGWMISSNTPTSSNCFVHMAGLISGQMDENIQTRSRHHGHLGEGKSNLANS